MATFDILMVSSGPFLRNFGPPTKSRVTDFIDCCEITDQYIDHNMFRRHRQRRLQEQQANQQKYVKHYYICIFNSIKNCKYCFHRFT